MEDAKYSDTRVTPANFPVRELLTGGLVNGDPNSFFQGSEIFNDILPSDYEGTSTDPYLAQLFILKNMSRFSVNNLDPLHNLFNMERRYSRIPVALSSDEEFLRVNFCKTNYAFSALRQGKALMEASVSIRDAALWSMSAHLIFQGQNVEWMAKDYIENCLKAGELPNLLDLYREIRLVGLLCDLKAKRGTPLIFHPQYKLFNDLHNCDHEKLFVELETQVNPKTRLTVAPHLFGSLIADSGSVCEAFSILNEIPKSTLEVMYPCDGRNRTTK